MPKPASSDRHSEAAIFARQPDRLTRVWDPVVRLFHWSLVASFALAWLSSHSSENVHQWSGYAAAGLILLRLAWGIVGTRYARFSQFVRDPMTITNYLIAIIRSREARYVGHNPAGGAMIVALIAAMAGTAFSGWLMTTDAYFGVEWVERAHDLSAHGLLLLVLIHVGGVILASFRHRENLVGAMITGKKRNAGPGDFS
jgi:cytochrome b